MAYTRTVYTYSQIRPKVDLKTRETQKTKLRMMMEEQNEILLQRLETYETYLNEINVLERAKKTDDKTILTWIKN